MKICGAILALTVLMTSCASTMPERPSGFGAYQAAVVEVVADTVEHVGQAQMLQTMLVDTLQERQVFRAVGKTAVEPADATVIVQARITRLREASNLDRITLGEMASSNVIAVDIVVMDGATQQVLSGFALRGESPDYPPGSNWPWGSLEDAMERLARRLANILLEWKTHSDQGR